MRDADRLPTDCGLELAVHGMRRCSVKGCTALLWSGDTCRRCAAEIGALEDWYLAHPARRASWLLNVPCIAFAVAVLWYLIWCFRDYIIACADLWCGGGWQ